MKLNFLNTVPYVCEQWEKEVQQNPAAPFLTEEISENGVLGKWYTINVPDTNNAKRNLKQLQKMVGFIS